jgi:2'-5' RNA ligase
MTMSDPVRAVYDRLWAEARDSFAAGVVRADPHLRDRTRDTRRGISLIIRPDAATIERISAIMNDLRAFAPEQHFYRPDELHMTVLSLISVADQFDLDAVPLATYRAVCEAVIPSTPPFDVRYYGLAASPDSVFVCGDSAGNALNVLRDRLRTALHEAGLGGTLDRRYRLITAHSTIQRFVSTPRDLPGLAEYIATRRDHDLGCFAVAEIAFVRNDWFMSHDAVMVLGRYGLRVT